MNKTGTATHRLPAEDGYICEADGCFDSARFVVLVDGLPDWTNLLGVVFSCAQHRRTDLPDGDALPADWEARAVAQEAPRG